MITIDNSQVKILLVDDTPENLKVAGNFLKRYNYDLYVADSGKSALEIIESNQFDLILLDIMMPGMDGFEVCRRIKSREEFKDVPVIFLTAKAEIESVIKGFEVGAVDYIKKPFNALELHARIKTHIELKRYREELELKNMILREANEKLEMIATTDPLTNLLNRREMQRKIEEERIRFERSNRQFSIIITDIDNFKRVNDSYGHDCGDYLLVAISVLLKMNIRKQDSLSRWGGEEFLLLLPETNLDGAAVIAEKLRKIIENHLFRYNTIDLKITMTFGVSMLNGKETVDQCIIKADKALYKGKQSTKNCVVIEEQV